MRVTELALRLATSININYATAGVIEDIAEITGSQSWMLTAEEIQTMIDAGELPRDRSSHQENVAKLMRRQAEKMARLLGLPEEDVAAFAGDWYERTLDGAGL